MTAHWLNDDTLISRLARLCKMSVPTVRAMLPMKIPVADLTTFGEAETARHFGCITEPEWREFCYRWRDGADRFYDLGQDAAARWAADNDLPPPLSDRDPTEEA
jgi:hypothetical protein